MTHVTLARVSRLNRLVTMLPGVRTFLLILTIVGGLLALVAPKRS